MVRAVFPTPPSPNTTNLYKVILAAMMTDRKDRNGTVQEYKQEPSSRGSMECSETRWLVREEGLVQRD